MEEIRTLLWMVMVFGAGNPQIWKILRRHQTPQKAAEVLHHPEIDEELHLPEFVRRRLKQVTQEQVDKMLITCEKQKLSILWYGDAAYLEQLLSIENPPVLLFYQGNITLLQNHMLLTVVGTRNPTEYSLRIEKLICYDLVQVGFVPVTGFAVGVDIAANVCALEQEKPSIALMGCGLDQYYPHQHATMKQEIAKRGLILSEFLPGTPPNSSNFPLRNRVLSGLSMGTFVIQAPLRSGALITAENAMEQGRDVFCIPPADITDRRYMGVAKYLRDGAIPVFHSQDIIYEYYTSHAHMMTASVLYEDTFRKSDSLVMAIEVSNEKRFVNERKKKETQVPSKVKATEMLHEEPLNDFEKTAVLDVSERELQVLSREVLAILQKHTVVHFDYLASVLEASMQDLNAALTELEIYGYLEHLPGKQFRLR